VLKLRTARPEDAEAVCEIGRAHDPDEPQDPDVVRHRWSVSSPDWLRERFVVESDSQPVGFAFRAHPWWGRPEDRWAYNDVRVRPDRRDRAEVGRLFDRLEAANVEEGAHTLAARTKEGFDWEVGLLEDRGYRYDRLSKAWQLDLGAHRDALLAERARGRQRTRRQGLELVTEAATGDPEILQKLWALNEETTQDVPTTLPHEPVSFEEFKQWSGPDVRPDRSWVARDGDGVVAWSFLRYPRVGRVWTGYTCCARSHRGRGIARAVKMETLGQAIELGVESVRTDNDEANAPMLHINQELGYHRIPGFISYLKEPG
jgi:mycothiol synthase